MRREVGKVENRCSSASNPLDGFAHMHSPVAFKSKYVLWGKADRTAKASRRAGTRPGLKDRCRKEPVFPLCSTPTSHSPPYPRVYDEKSAHLRAAWHVIFPIRSCFTKSIEPSLFSLNSEFYPLESFSFFLPRSSHFSFRH